MTTLRVRIAAPQAPDQPLAWALYDDAGRVVDRGVAQRRALPAASRTEGVLAASVVRMTSIALPPLGASRVAAAAAYALEDQLAGPADAHHIATSRQAPDGRVTVVIASQRDVAALARSREPSFDRVVAEPDLAPAGAAWRWCTGADGAGFVRLPDGGAFAVDAGDASAVPHELALALQRARRDGAPASEVVVDAGASEPDLARWSHELGVRFSRGAPWRWEDAPPQRFAEAIDLLQRGSGPSSREAAASAVARLWRPALALVVAAATIHALAAIADWTSARFEGWRQAREWTALARAAGARESEARDAPTAMAAIAKRHADARHAHGVAAPSDALPLLARAAPALAALTPGALRSASYADGHWTLDLARLDAAAAARLDDALRNSGTPALMATSDAGTRVRIGAP